MTGIIVFFVSAVVTFLNIGMRADYFAQWIRSFGIGWPIAAVVGFFTMPVARIVTERQEPVPFLWKRDRLRNSSLAHVLDGEPASTSPEHALIAWIEKAG